MLDPTQILLFTVIIILTLLIFFIGIQLHQILREIYKMLVKVNLMVDDMQDISYHLGRSVRSIGGFSEGLKVALGFFNLFKRKEIQK